MDCSWRVSKRSTRQMLSVATFFSDSVVPLVLCLRRKGEMANQSSSHLSEPALGCLQFAEGCLSAALSLCNSNKPGYIRKPPFLCSAFLLTSLRVALIELHR